MVSIFPNILSVGYDSCLLFSYPSQVELRPIIAPTYVRREPAQAGKKPTEVGNDSILGDGTLGSWVRYVVANRATPGSRQ